MRHAAGCSKFDAAVERDEAILFRAKTLENCGTRRAALLPRSQDGNQVAKPSAANRPATMSADIINW
jgi:hypothetical protein